MGDSGTHGNDTEDTVEARPPSGNRFPVVTCIEKSREWTPSALFDDFALDLHCGSVTKGIVGELSKLSTDRLTHSLP